MSNEDLAARAQRLQTEIDTARELLRAAGVKGFGSLSEGIAAALRGKSSKRDRLPFAVSVTAEQMAQIIRRMSARVGAMVDPDTHAPLSLKYECLALIVNALAQALEVDHVKALIEMERELQHVMADVVAELKKRESAR